MSWYIRSFAILDLPTLTANSPPDRQITEITCELPQDTNIQDLILLDLDLEGELGWEISLLWEFLCDLR